MPTRSEDDELQDTLPGMPIPTHPFEPPYEDLAQLAVQITCNHCRAAAGEWCRTKSGHGAANLHAARWLVVQSIFWLGFHCAEDFLKAEQRRLMGEYLKRET
jgi:hypothetical protein